MNLIETFQHQWLQSSATIERFRSTPSSMQGLVEWMITTDANPRRYLPVKSASAFQSIDAFAALLTDIHHAIYGSGDIAFVTVNDEPRIAFVCPYCDNFNSKVINSYGQSNMVYGDLQPVRVDVMKIQPYEFGPMHDAFMVSEMKQQFAKHAGQYGVSTAIQQYSTLPAFDGSWIEQCADDIGKWAKIYSAS